MTDDNIKKVVKNLVLAAKNQEKPITLSQQNVTVPLSFMLTADVMAHKFDIPKRPLNSALDALEDIGAISRTQTKKKNRKSVATTITLMRARKPTS